MQPSRKTTAHSTNAAAAVASSRGLSIIAAVVRALVLLALAPSTGALRLRATPDTAGTEATALLPPSNAAAAGMAAAGVLPMAVWPGDVIVNGGDRAAMSMHEAEPRRGGRALLHGCEVQTYAPLQTPPVALTMP